MSHCHSGEPFLREDSNASTDTESPPSTTFSLRNENGMNDVVLTTIDEDIFGMAIVMLVYNMSAHRSVGIRTLRFALTFSLLFAVLFVQAFVIYQVKTFVSARYVHDVRIIYDQYEIHMYGNNTDNMVATVNGLHRGTPEFFDPTLFESLSTDVKERACRIPFSHPAFFFIVLVLWSLSCVSELNKVLVRFICIIVKTERSSTMSSVFEGKYEAVSRHCIHRLTGTMKVLICTCIFLPRLIITCCLLWLGCRWLTATSSFTELILNGLALQFVLDLKFLIYEAAAPMRARFEIEHTKMLPIVEVIDDSYALLLGGCSWVAISICWSYFYLFHQQQVLPQYNWDVSSVCQPWLLRDLSV